MSASGTKVRYFYGLGRRKTAVARVRLYPGNGEFTVNGKSAAEYFGGRELHQMVIRQLFKDPTMTDSYHVMVRVVGGGPSGQAGAIRHGVARALTRVDAELRPAVKRAGFLTRDPRMKERKKVGLKRARKAPQYTKR